MSDPKITKFRVVGRRRLHAGRPWSRESSVGTDLDPREARGLLIRQAAFMVEHGWEIVGINRTTITLETPNGARYELRMQKEPGS